MSKITITEERLNSLIQECVEEVMLEEDFRGTMQNAWNGVKNFAGNVGQGAKAVAGAAGRGIKNAASKVGQGVKNSGGIIPYAANLRGYAERRAEQFKNKVAQARRAGRAAADAKALQGPHPANYWKEKYGDNFVTLMGQILGGSYPKDRLVQALNTYNVSPEDQAEILKSKGYGATNGADQNAPMAEPSLNPANQQNKNGLYSGNLGGNAGMDSAIEEAVANVIKSYINEVGDTLKGQYKLGRLYADRRNKANDLNEPIDAASRAHDFDTKWGLKDKQDNLFYRAHNAYNKAHDERMSGPMPMFPSDPKGKMMQNSYWVGEDIGMIKNKLEALKQRINDRKNGTKEELNEIGDTYKGQYKLGRLSGKRDAQASKISKQISKSTDDKEIEDLRNKRGDFINRSTAAYVKARDERDAKGNSWEPHQMQMMSAFNDGQKKEIKKSNKLNEVGDTVKGQKKLGKLAGKRIGQSWKYTSVGDDEKADEYAGRYQAASTKARQERDEAGSGKQRKKMRKAYFDAANKEAGVAQKSKWFKK